MTPCLARRPHRWCDAPGYFPAAAYCLVRSSPSPPISAPAPVSEGADILFEVFLRGENRFRDLPVQQSAQRADVGHLRVMLVPHRVGKAAPWQSELRPDDCRHGDFMGHGAGPGLVPVLFQIVGVRGDSRKNGLRGTK